MSVVSEFSMNSCIILRVVVVWQNLLSSPVTTFLLCTKKPQTKNIVQHVFYVNLASLSTSADWYRLNPSICDWLRTQTDWAVNLCFAPQFVDQIYIRNHTNMID